MSNLFANKKILILVVFFILAILLILFLQISGNITQSPGGLPSLDGNIQNQGTSTLSVASFTPETSFPLIPDQNITFKISFNNPVSLSDLSVSLVQEEIITEGVSIVPINLLLENENKTLAVTPQTIIKGYSEYNLVIKDKSGRELLNETYLSNQPIPTPAASNNLELSNFLPHETSNYRLSYLPSRNIYIFNFIYNPNSSEDLQTQYERAKQQAEEFIESKGINLEEIVIEWRYS